MAVNNTTEFIELPVDSGNGEARGFYIPAEASRIAQIPQWTLNSWRRDGIIVPSVEWIDEQGKAHLGHTFETLVFLRLIRMLRKSNITLLKAVETVKALRDRFGPPGKGWADARIFTQYGDVFVHAKDEWGTTVTKRGQQKLADLLFGEEFARLRDRVDALLIPFEFQSYVEIDPVVRNGLPIVLDTSVLTSIIHSLRQRGCEYNEIHANYPFISCDVLIGVNGYEDFLDKANLVG